ncbi:MAG: beta-galactosidase [Lachnospiraceae bacterium]|nr:beta-galactosidase [Lachnospiraceae bacterium]
MIKLIYCNKSTLNYNHLSSFFSKNGWNITCLSIDKLTPEQLASTDVLINAMDSCYPEEQLPLLVEYFHRGGHIINLCPTPFTVSLETGQTNHRALRSFTVVDDFHKIDGSSSSVSTWYGDTANLSLTNLHGGVYHMCERVNGVNKRIAYFEHLMDAYDTDGNFLSAAILRIVTHNMGSMTLCNFDVTSALDPDSNTCVFVQNALLQTVRKCLAGTALLTVDAEFSRFTPEEQKSIRISAAPLTIADVTKVNLHISVTKEADTASNSDSTLVYCTCKTVTLPYETEFSPELTESGLYKIEARLVLQESEPSENIPPVVITSCTTGILVLSEEELLAGVQSFSPLEIDESVSTDYCIQNGELTAILGTTYFVTDVYRECFYYMNAWLCHKEMQLLKSDGFNVLRTGNWYFLPEFYNPDGSIGKRGLRALETYFYLAAEQGFTVQFALGTVLLNQWDSSRSPIHDAGMRKQCMTLIRSFAESFKKFNNVQMDIVNEPSYSNRGAWSPGKPDLDAVELSNYKKWLKKKYGTIQHLRTAWGETALVLDSFDDVTMPENHLFNRGLARTEQRMNHVMLNDFFCFAREEFSGWTREIRSIVKEIAPDMIVIMGRDETMRIPEQQTEVLAGNIDMVCWHQWNYNSDIFTEYLMNRVRGKICVAQELGMYKFDDIRSGKRHTDEEMIDKLNNKLLCSFGNFVQWQSHDDPFMWELSENSLGIYRADYSPTPSLQATRDLVRAERNIQHLMKHRDYDAVNICTVYGTSYHYSLEHQFALQGIRNFTAALFHEVKEQSDFLPEHLFRKEYASAIGNPKLIILPGMQMLSMEAWQELLAYVTSGTTLLVNGCIDKNNCFGAEAKIGALDKNYSTRHLRDFEKIRIDGKDYVLDFRRMTGYADVANILDCGEIIPEDVCSAKADVSSAAAITEYNVGKGTILYCPYPLELSANTEAMAACYRYAIQKAKAANTMFRAEKGTPAILLNAAAYEACTVYTIVNDGPADTVTFTDLRSGITFTVSLGTICGGKLWINEKGEILQTYGKISVAVS